MRKFPRVCSVTECRKCDIPEHTPECLERKANYCIWLSTQPLGQPLRADLEQLSFDFIQAAEELREKERSATKSALPTVWRPYLNKAR